MKLFRWLTLYWAIATLILLGMPASSLPSSGGIPHADKLVHFLIFAAGSFVACRGWPHRTWPVLISLLLFASFTESWQGLLPTSRNEDLLDTMANLVGVAAGAVAARRNFGNRHP